MIYNKSQQSRKTAGLCPNINWPENKKSAICKIANDTLINSVKLCSALAKLDTGINIIAEFISIVNLFEKEHVVGYYTSTLMCAALLVYSFFEPANQSE